MLSPEQLTKIEEVLVAGCEKHIAGGGTIVYGMFANSLGGCDPIWACIDKELLATKNIKWPLNQAHWGLIQAVGFTMSEISMTAFCAGFDGITNCGDDDMYALGEKLRAKYITNRKDVNNESDTSDVE